MNAEVISAGANKKLVLKTSSVTAKRNKRISKRRERKCRIIWEVIL